MLRGFISATTSIEETYDNMEFEGMETEDIMETLGEQEKMLDGDFFNGKSTFWREKERLKELDQIFFRF